MVRCLGLLLLLVSCAFPSPPPPTVVNRTPFQARPDLDRPFLVAVPVVGYELARFGFGTAVDKRYDTHKILGHYLTAYDWTTRAFSARTFWEGRGAGNGRDVAPEPSGPRYVMGAQGWSSLDPADGLLTSGTFPPNSKPLRHVRSGLAVLAVSSGPGALTTTLWTFSLATGQTVGPGRVLSPAPGRSDLQVAGDLVDAQGRFWISTFGGSLYRYDPQTQELLTVRQEPAGSGFSVALLGVLGSQVLASRYPLGVLKPEPTPADILVFDAADPAVVKTVALTLPQGGWVPLGADVQGTFHFLVQLPWDLPKPPVYQLWTLDPAAGTAADTGLAFGFWVNGELAVRDNRLFVFSTFAKDRTLTVGMADLTNKTVTVTDLSLVQAAQP